MYFCILISIVYIFIHRWEIAIHFSKWARIPLAGQSSSKRMKTSSSTNSSDACTKFEINLSDEEVDWNAHSVEINQRRWRKNHTLG
ncbi:hypothetical protein Hanom_Chr00s002180g01692931 [Helianthus anomalus]